MISYRDIWFQPFLLTGALYFPSLHVFFIVFLSINPKARGCPVLLGGERVVTMMEGFSGNVCLGVVDKFERNLHGTLGM
jgi:hypothetical protein